jgi:hypothetical protein
MSTDRVDFYRSVRKPNRVSANFTRRDTGNNETTKSPQQLTNALAINALSEKLVLTVFLTRRQQTGHRYAHQTAVQCS